MKNHGRNTVRISIQRQMCKLKKIRIKRIIMSNKVKRMNLKINIRKRIQIHLDIFSMIGLKIIKRKTGLLT